MTIDMEEIDMDMDINIDYYTNYVYGPTYCSFFTGMNV